MKRLKIIKNSQVVQFCDFSSEDAINSFIEVLNQGDSGWGKPEHTIVVKEAVYDEDGVLLEEEVTELVPAEFTIEIEDITEEVNQKQINEEAELFLKQTDWMVVRFVDSGTPIPEEIKEQRALARARIVG